MAVPLGCATLACGTMPGEAHIGRSCVSSDFLSPFQRRNEYLVSGHPTIQDPGSVPEEFDDPLDHKALAFQYIEETYTLWLDLRDDFTDCNVIMEERYREYHII